MDKHSVAEIIYGQVVGIDYDNFKNSVVDSDYSAGLSSCWHGMYHALQEPKEKRYA